MHAIKVELEDLGFRALYPRRYRVIESAVRKAKGNQKQFVAKIAETLKSALDKAGIPAASRAARRTSTASTRRCAARRSR